MPNDIFCSNGKKCRCTLLMQELLFELTVQSKTTIKIYKGDSPWRADARRGSAHARNYRRICRQFEAANATQHILPRGTMKNGSRLNEEKENAGIRFNKPGTTLAIWHTMTNSSKKTQHCCCSNNSSIATDRAAASALRSHIN